MEYITFSSWIMTTPKKCGHTLYYTKAIHLKKFDISKPMSKISIDKRFEYFISIIEENNSY